MGTATFVETLENINSSMRADPESNITHTHHSSSQPWLQGLFIYLFIYK
jgi:hypothetical protein